MWIILLFYLLGVGNGAEVERIHDHLEKADDDGYYYADGNYAARQGSILVISSEAQHLGRVEEIAQLDQSLQLAYQTHSIRTIFKNYKKNVVLTLPFAESITFRSEVALMDEQTDRNELVVNQD